MKKRITSILIVDDDTDDQELLQEAIQTVAPSVSWMVAINGEEALKILQAPGAPLPDLIFLDLNLTTVNGKAVLDMLKQNKRLKSIKVILFSGNAPDNYQSFIDKDGATAFYVKPSSGDGYKKIVEEVINGIR